jgi:hypothetical protein
MVMRPQTFHIIFNLLTSHRDGEPLFGLARVPSARLGSWCFGCHHLSVYCSGCHILCPILQDLAVLRNKITHMASDPHSSVNDCHYNSGLVCRRSGTKLDQSASWHRYRHIRLGIVSSILGMGCSTNGETSNNMESIIQTYGMLIPLFSDLC